MARISAKSIPAVVAIGIYMLIRREHPKTAAAIGDFIKEWFLPAIVIIVAASLALGIVGLSIYGLYRLVKPNNRPHAIPSIVAIVMLLGTFFGPPGGYYDILRFVVCGTAIFVAFVGYKTGFEWAVWLFGPTALLFNPIFPFHLGREIWAVVDVAAAILFIVGIIVIKMRPLTDHNSVISTESRRVPRQPEDVQEAVIVTVMDPDDTATSKPEAPPRLPSQKNVSQTLTPPSDFVPDIDDFIIGSETNRTTPSQNIVESSDDGNRSETVQSFETHTKKPMRFG